MRRGSNRLPRRRPCGTVAAAKGDPARWFYDTTGSELFEEITALPEYYPTRSETDLLTATPPTLRAAVGPGRAVVEFGSGSSTKTPLLLGAIAPARLCADRYFGRFPARQRRCARRTLPRPAHLCGRGRFHPTRRHAARDLPAAANSAFSPARPSATWSRAPRSICSRDARRRWARNGLLLIGFDRIKDIARCSCPPMTMRRG